MGDCLAIVSGFEWFWIKHLENQYLEIRNVNKTCVKWTWGDEVCILYFVLYLLHKIWKCYQRVDRKDFCRFLWQRRKRRLIGLRWWCLYFVFSSVLTKYGNAMKGLTGWTIVRFWLVNKTCGEWGTVPRWCTGQVSLFAFPSLVFFRLQSFHIQIQIQERRNTNTKK